MKKLMLIFVLLISSLTQMYAQDTISYILPDVPTSMQVCCGTVIAIYTTETSCDDWGWWVNNVSHGQENPLILQSQVEHLFRVEYGGCDIAYFGNIGYVGWSSATPLTCNLWKRFGETMTIEPVGTDSLTWFDYLWSTGATTSTIDVTEPGTYTCQITDFCGTATRTFIVRDNSEITLATCDLESNLKIAVTDGAKSDKVLDDAQADSILTYVTESIDGVYSMSSEVEGLVESSSNIGQINVSPGAIEIRQLPRSSSDAKLEEIHEHQSDLAEKNGFDISINDDTKAWPVNPYSTLAEQIPAIYKEQNGKDMIVTGLHAGLECAEFYRKNPSIDMVSIGPDIDDVHSPNEVVHLDSIPITWNVLKELLVSME